MVKAYLLIPLVMLLSSCSGIIDPADFKQTNNTPLSTPTAGAPPAVKVSAPTGVPTATIGYQETAIVAQQTANAAMELMVQATAQKDRQNFEQSAWTVTAEYMFYQRDQLTQSASAVTASAYPTTVPLTQTQQAVVNNVRATEQYMTMTAPTQIVAIARSKTYAENANWILGVELGLKGCIGLFVILLSIYVAVQIVSMIFKPASVVTKPVIPNLDEKNIPFKTEIKDGGLTMQRAEIPCSVDQLLEFADGIIYRHMTTAFNVWENTIVHKNLKDIREFLVDHHFAKVIRGSGGALDVQSEGEAFLIQCLELGSPPPPYQCIG